VGPPAPLVPLPPGLTVEPEQAATKNAEINGRARRDRARMKLIFITE
jgi:hypothetical protein